jgi:hypothetical protein
VGDVIRTRKEAEQSSVGTCGGTDGTVPGKELKLCEHNA